MADEHQLEWQEYLLSDNPATLDVDFIHGFLTRSHWSQGISIEIVRRAIHHSLCFGVYHGQEQVGFARVISDRATFAYLCDVFVIEAHRGFGLSRTLVRHILSHPQLQGLRKIALYTSKAHDIYRDCGFSESSDRNWMEIHDKEIYLNERQSPEQGSGEIPSSNK